MFESATPRQTGAPSEQLKCSLSRRVGQSPKTLRAFEKAPDVLHPHNLSWRIPEESALLGLVRIPLDSETGVCDVERVGLVELPGRPVRRLVVVGVLVGIKMQSERDDVVAQVPRYRCVPGAERRCAIGYIDYEPLAWTFNVRLGSNLRLIELEYSYHNDAPWILVPASKSTRNEE